MIQPSRTDKEQLDRHEQTFEHVCWICRRTEDELMKYLNVVELKQSEGIIWNTLGLSGQRFAYCPICSEIITDVVHYLAKTGLQDEQLMKTLDKNEQKMLRFLSIVSAPVDELKNKL